MSISFEKALGIHDDALRLRSQRSSILANNLANVDTPHYKARDFDFKQVLTGAMQTHQLPSVAMKTTHAGHQVGKMIPSPVNNLLLYRTPQQPSIDGNTVEEHVEHAEFTKNALDYQTSFSFLNGSFKGLKRAIKGEP